MVSYQIEWDGRVLRRFTDTYDLQIKAHQTRMMDTLDATDRLLKAKPLEVGESRASETQRILIEPPITLAYQVNLRLRIVTIVDAHILPIDR